MPSQLRIKSTLAAIKLAIFIYPIKAYQYFISPWLGHHCRFYPSCSQYAIEAIQKYGFCKGFYRMIKRLFRCHPWCEGGYDPVK